MITLGNEDNITLKVGTETVVAVYMGTEQVYPDTPPTPQYRWVNIDPNEQADCVERVVETTNPGELTVTESYYDAYYLQKKQVSTDGGTTWTDVSPLETQRGELYEENSSLCFGTGGGGDVCYTIESNGGPLGDEIWSSDGTQLYGYVNDDEGIYYDTDGNPYPQVDYLFDIEYWLSEVVGVECQSGFGGM